MWINNAQFQLIFSMLDMIPYDNGPTTFITFAFVIRICLALGCTACANATFAIAIHIFRDNPATVLVSIYIYSYKQ